MRIIVGLQPKKHDMTPDDFCLDLERDKHAAGFIEELQNLLYSKSIAEQNSIKGSPQERSVDSLGILLDPAEATFHLEFNLIGRYDLALQASSESKKEYTKTLQELKNLFLGLAEEAVKNRGLGNLFSVSVSWPARS